MKPVVVKTDREKRRPHHASMLRMADDLWNLLLKAADEHGQSVNAEINDRLRRTFRDKTAQE